MEREKLFIDINGPFLSMDRRIHTRQNTDKGIQFGATKNKYGANLIRIEMGETYSIIYIRYSKPKFDKTTKQFKPHSFIVKHKREGLDINELRTILNESFK